MASLLISKAEAEATIKEANQIKATIDKTQLELSCLDQEVRKALAEVLPMKERADEAERKVDQN